MIDLTSLKETIKKSFRNTQFVIGFLLITAFVLLAVLAPFLTPYSYAGIDLSSRLQPPSLVHLFGTDSLGRDLFTRIIFGAQISIMVSMFAVSVSMIVAVPLGLISGYWGGKVDTSVMYVVDLLMAFPSILLAILLITILGTGLNNLILTIGIFSIPVFVRVTRAQTLSVKEEDYVMAATALGENSFNVIRRYILPNILPVIIVQATLQIGSAILTTAGLGFLGLGVSPPLPEWGLMINQARPYLLSAPYVVFVPGFAILLFTLGFNFLGDGLNDILNPRQAEKIKSE